MCVPLCSWIALFAFSEHLGYLSDEAPGGEQLIGSFSLGASSWLSVCVCVCVFWLIVHQLVTQWQQPPKHLVRRRQGCGGSVSLVSHVTRTARWLLETLWQHLTELYSELCQFASVTTTTDCGVMLRWAIMTGHPSGPPPPARSRGYTSVIRTTNTVTARSELPAQSHRSPSVCLTRLSACRCVRMTGQATERDRSPHNLSVKTTLEEEIERAESILSRW